MKKAKVNRFIGFFMTFFMIASLIAIPAKVKAAEVVRSIGGTVTAQGDNSAKGEGMTNAFDGNTSTKWLDFQATSWIQYQFAEVIVYLVIL